MTSYLVEVAPIEESHGASLPLDKDLLITELVLGGEHYTLEGPAHVTGTLTNTGTAFLAEGTVTATLKAQCVRCLCDFDLPLEGDIEVYFVDPHHESEVPEDTESAPVSDGKVDLFPFVLGALTVAIPFAPLHDEECAGICPVCGADRNVEECSCAPSSTPTPFSDLGGLLEELRDEPLSDGE